MSDALREVLRLWRADPLGMLAATWLQLTREHEAAQQRLRKIRLENPDSGAAE